MWLNLVVHLALINMLLHRSHTKLCVLNDSANPKINNFPFRIISIIKFTLIFEIVLVTSDLIDHKHLRIKNIYLWNSAIELNLGNLGQRV